MNVQNNGWATCVMLIVVTVLMILIINSYQSNSYILMLARARYHHHQHLRLTEGLLKYGTVLCRENKELLLRWGMEDDRTMSLSFDPWPTEKLVACCGACTGLLSIMSRRGVLYLRAQLFCAHKTLMSGLCTLQLKDPENIKSTLYISSWNVPCY